MSPLRVISRVKKLPSLKEGINLLLQGPSDCLFQQPRSLLPELLHPPQEAPHTQVTRHLDTLVSDVHSTIDAEVGPLLTGE